MDIMPNLVFSLKVCDSFKVAPTPFGLLFFNSSDKILLPLDGVYYDEANNMLFLNKYAKYKLITKFIDLEKLIIEDKTPINTYFIKYHDTYSTYGIDVIKYDLLDKIKPCETNEDCFFIGSCKLHKNTCKTGFLILNYNNKYQSNIIFKLSKEFNIPNEAWIKFNDKKETNNKNI